MRDMEDYERGIEFEVNPSHQTDFRLYKMLEQPNPDVTEYAFCLRHQKPYCVAVIKISNEDGKTLEDYFMTEDGYNIFNSKDPDEYLDFDIAVSDLLLYKCVD